ncbi:hypothetical protein [Devosia sediminis]|uniref:Uncharacterized protein n=1 Tax=Devosia sediminis TaxID=2798801 RepID=A0A934MLA8_9HYPH|nr:hypothetical protein [Devosia sediminis]MBJ3784965.1 hypothetical protein [Devosia sediminis]
MNNRSLAIAAILAVVAFIGLFAGYFIGAQTARSHNAADTSIEEASG